MSEEKDRGLEGEGGWREIAYGEVELGEIIGGGGVGVIYMGWYKDKAVALKTLFDPRVDDKLKQEYLDELLVMSKVKHSNIVSFMGACMTSPHLFFMMELCENSLYNILHVDRVSFSERENMRIAVSLSYISFLLYCTLNYKCSHTHVGRYRFCDGVPTFFAASDCTQRFEKFKYIEILRRILQTV